ncbi:acyl carrier protein [Bosea sp. (in: a-proteobacteria)]|uniref:acyl carrier protein n=1 Tax=Bosea sp. (in: a-proteobacteria) TaxID=1871050 RepID=UPI00273485DB|nr:acyl carrier protein [Bosea sp. (in: a-proteobacteria)]MDP3407254.1 acyl carrier protein [Bosea sp. (in: a-proteobacteria)]
MSVIPQDIVDAIRAQLGSDDSFTRETLLQADLGLDSLDEVEIVVRLEGKRGIEVPDGVLDSMKTVGDLVAAIEGVAPSAGAVS